MVIVQQKLGDGQVIGYWRALAILGVKVGHVGVDETMGYEDKESRELLKEANSLYAVGYLDA